MIHFAAVLRLFLLILSVGFALVGTAPVASAQGLDLPGLDADAQGYARALTLKAPPAINQKAADEALAQASQALAAKNLATTATSKV